MGFSDREYAKRVRPGGPKMPPVTKALLIINVLVFLLNLQPEDSAVRPLDAFGAFRVADAVMGGKVWQFLTFQFLHDSVGHLLFNMLGIYFLAPFVERWWGSRKFLAYYLLCGAGGAAFFSLLYLIHLIPNSGPFTQLVGASAGLFGVLFAIYRINPAVRVSLLFPPVTLTMRQLAMFLAGLAVVMILGGLVMPDFWLFQNSGGEAGHLGGALMGLLLMRFPGLLGKGSKVIRPKQFRVRQERKIKPRTEVDLAAESEVDRILEKVHREGLQSLTSKEREMLDAASKKKP